MFGKPKSDVPDESNPEGLELSECVGLFFSFLWFYRGVFLACLVLYGLYSTLMMAKDTVAENKRRDAEAPAFVYVPTPAGNLAAPEKVSTVQPVPLPSQPRVRRPKQKTVSPPDSKTVRFQRFIATAEVASLFRRFKILMGEVPAVGGFEAVSKVRKCLQICESVRQNELTAEQQETFTIMELEAASQLDAINVQHDMRMLGVREQLLAASSKLLPHPSVSVSAKAHLAVVAAHAMDLMFTPTREELGALIDVYNTHVNGIILGQTAPLVVADLLEKLIDRHQFDEVIALRRDLTDRMLNDGTTDLKKMHEVVRERVVFGDLGLKTLVNRVEAMSEAAIRDVDLFYDRLERFPDARKKIYLVALALVDRHLGNDQFEKATELVAVLQRIQSQISDDETKDWFGELLAKYTEQMSTVQLAQ